MNLNLQAETAYAQLCDLTPERFSLGLKLKRLSTFSFKNGYWYEHVKMADGTIKQQALKRRVKTPEEYVQKKKQESDVFKKKYANLLKIEHGLVKMLRPLYGGLDRDATRILKRFAEVGLTTERCLLVGTNAFLSYAPQFGWLKPAFLQRTCDIDVAVSILTSNEFRMFSENPLDLEGILASTGLHFTPSFNFLAAKAPTKFISETGYSIDLLAAVKGAPGKIVEVAGMVGVGAEALRFMDFLTREKRQTVLLGVDCGIMAVVPTPERFAVHKLLIAPLRKQTSLDHLKRNKDFAQAKKIIISIIESDYHADLVEVWNEAVTSGKSARKNLKKSMPLLNQDTISKLSLAGANTDFSIHGKTTIGK